MTSQKTNRVRRSPAKTTPTRRARVAEAAREFDDALLIKSEQAAREGHEVKTVANSGESVSALTRASS